MYAEIKIDTKKVSETIYMYQLEFKIVFYYEVLFKNTLFLIYFIGLYPTQTFHICPFYVCIYVETSVQFQK